ncbi:uncharacterized protein BDV17DRAFT_251072 [Aspergillus undulatus]|uniref:uncharacterized protein n=1 Tax=Aspergillus undulatus TaxID=1810928 RepID=UPI003CCCE97E
MSRLGLMPRTRLTLLTSCFAIDQPAPAKLHLESLSQFTASPGSLGVWIRKPHVQRGHSQAEPQPGPIPWG